MSLNNLVKRLQDVMRNDAGINGDAQRIEQIVWILFLKIYDAKEQEWKLLNDGYQSILPDRLSWENWAKDNKDGKAMTGEALLNFVNNDLFPVLKNLPVSPQTPMNQRIVRAAFEDNNNYMKNGVLLRQVINIIDEINFEQYQERHAFGDIYENILKSLQSAGNAGEFYTPRAVTDFMVKMISPKLGERIADFACGTGGFLTSALKVLEPQIQSVNDRTLFASFQKERSEPDEFLKTQFKSLDCSIMELADDIAYGVHDLEDAIVTGVVNQHQWQEALDELKTIPSDWLAKNIEQVSQRLFSNHHFERKNAIGALVNFFITHVRWKVTGNFDEPLLRYNAELPQDVIAALNVFKKFVWKYVIRHVETQRIEYKGQRILTEMFQIFESDPERLLPTNTANRWRNAPEQGKKRIICDYIAGMSDAYALKVYHQL